MADEEGHAYSVDGSDYSERLREMFGDQVLVGERLADTWLSLPIEARGINYGFAAMALFDDVGSVPPEAWYIIGQAVQDPEGVDWTHNEFIKANMQYNIQEILSNDYIDATIRTMTDAQGKLLNGNQWDQGKTFEAIEAFNFGKSGSTTGFGSIVAKDTTLGELGNLALTFGSIYYGGSIAVKGSAQVMRGARFLRGTKVGKVVADGLATAARSDSHAFIYGQKFARYGSRIALGNAVSFTGAGIWAASVLDPTELQAQLLTVVERAQLENAGFRFEQQGEAFGPDGPALFQTDEVILDQNGKPVSLDDAKRLAGIINTADTEVEAVSDVEGTDEDNITTTTTAPTFQGADAPIPGTTEQFAGTGQSSGIYDDDEFVTGAEVARAIAAGAALQDKETAEDRYNKDPYIGVPRDYIRDTRPDTSHITGADRRFLPRYNPRDPSDSRNRPEVTGADRRFLPPVPYGSPRYNQSDVMDEIAKWSYLDIIKFQEQAVAAGLINPDSSVGGASFIPGSFDAFTERALTGAMNQANVNGDNQTYWDALDEMIEGREKAKEIYGDSEQPPTWVAPTYFAPDYATISQNVKSVFSQRLGREPNGWEMDLLADQFKADHRAEFDAEVLGPDQRARNYELDNFDARGRAEEPGEVEIPDLPSETVQGVDPLARMFENFDTEFSNELGARQRWDSVQSKTSNLFGSLSRLGNA